MNKPSAKCVTLHPSTAGMYGFMLSFKQNWYSSDELEEKGSKLEQPKVSDWHNLSLV